MTEKYIVTYDELYDIYLDMTELYCLGVDTHYLDRATDNLKIILDKLQNNGGENDRPS